MSASRFVQTPPGAEDAAAFRSDPVLASEPARFAFRKHRRGSLMTLLFVIAAWVAAALIGLRLVIELQQNPENTVLVILFAIAVVALPVYLTRVLIRGRKQWFEVASGSKLNSEPNFAVGGAEAAQRLVDAFEAGDVRRFPSLQATGDVKVGLHTGGSATLLVTVWVDQADGALVWPPIEVRDAEALRYATRHISGGQVYND